MLGALPADPVWVTCAPSSSGLKSIFNSIHQLWLFTTTTHPGERPESGTPTPPNAGQVVEPQEFSLAAGGNADGQPLGRQVVSYKTKHIFIIHFRNCAPWYLSKRAESLCPHKTCPWMFPAASPITAQAWGHPWCPAEGDGYCGPSGPWMVLRAHVTRAPRPRGDKEDL